MLTDDGAGMTDFFSRLAGRSMGVTRVVQPRIRSRYAAPVPEDADTQLVREAGSARSAGLSVREAGSEQSGGLPVAARLQDDRPRGHSSSPSYARDAVPLTEPRKASRPVPAGSVESGRSAVRDVPESVPADPAPFSS